jgi:hypothetical protein
MNSIWKGKNYQLKANRITFAFFYAEEKLKELVMKSITKFNYEYDRVGYSSWNSLRKWQEYQNQNLRWYN